MNIIGQGRFLFARARGRSLALWLLIGNGHEGQKKWMDTKKQVGRGNISSVLASAATAHVGSSGLFGRFGAADIVHAQEETSGLSASRVSTSVSCFFEFWIGVGRAYGWHRTGV